MKEIGLNTILLAIAVATLGWIGLTTQQSSNDISAIKTKLEVIVKTQDDQEQRLRDLERHIRSPL